VTDQQRMEQLEAALQHEVLVHGMATCEGCSRVIFDWEKEGDTYRACKDPDGGVLHVCEECCEWTPDQVGF
jgi:hypothetical protein